MSPSRRRSSSTMRATCRALRVIAVSTSRSVAPLGTRAPASGRMVPLPLLDQTRVEGALAQHRHDARGRASIAVRIGLPVEPPPEVGLERGPDPAHDVVTPRGDV